VRLLAIWLLQSRPLRGGYGCGTRLSSRVPEGDRCGIGRLCYADPPTSPHSSWARCGVLAEDVALELVALLPGHAGDVLRIGAGQTRPQLRTSS
jgi:hypothetical protein